MYICNMATLIKLSEFLTPDTIARITELLDENDDDTNTHYADMTSSLINLLGIEIETGDIIQLDSEVYRNDTKMVWDGGKCVLFVTEPDEYGSIPPLPQLSVPDVFPIGYWNETVAHNNLVPFAHGPFVDQILASHVMDSDLHYYTDFDTPVQHKVVRRNEKGEMVEVPEPHHQISKATFTIKKDVETVYTIYYEWVSPKLLTLDEMTKQLTAHYAAHPVSLYESDTILEDYLLDVDTCPTFDPKTTLLLKFDTDSPLDETEDE
jgi:hypothetical protein